MKEKRLEKCVRREEWRDAVSGDDNNEAAKTRENRENRLASRQSQTR